MVSDRFSVNDFIFLCHVVETNNYRIENHDQILDWSKEIGIEFLIQANLMKVFKFICTLILIP